MPVSAFPSAEWFLEMKLSLPHTAIPSPKFERSFEIILLLEREVLIPFPQSNMVLFSMIVFEALCVKIPSCLTQEIIFLLIMLLTEFLNEIPL